MAELGESRCRRLRPPAGQTRKPVGRITDQGEIVGDRLWSDAELGDDSVFVANRTGSAIELDNPAVLDALRQVLVRRADEHPLDPRIPGGNYGAGRQRIVSL